MTVEVTFAGATYDVPEDKDVGWADLTDYLVALSSAQSGEFDVKSVRITTATSDSLSANEDYALGVNASSSANVTLPAGIEGQIFVVFDASGDAIRNTVTVATTGGQTINGESTYVIRSNRGAVAVQFNGTEWSVLNSREVTVEQNTTNTSMIDASLHVTNAGVAVSNLESCTFTISGDFCEFIVVADGSAMKCCCSVLSNIVDCVWDTENMFLESDAGTGIYVSKSSDVVTIKNRSGSALIKVTVLTGGIASATAWS